MINKETYFFPWVKRGLSNRITEVDQLGNIHDPKSLSKFRPVIKIEVDFEKSLQSKESESTEIVSNDIISEYELIDLIGPGDILKVNSSAIMKVNPPAGSKGFATSFYPYIEFWESDFPWRYSPSAPNNNRLTPWLSLVVHKTSLCKITPKHDGVSFVSFDFADNDDYTQIFPNPTEIWKTAHAQGPTIDGPNISRVIALRETESLEPNEKYTAFLIPSFEVGRLRGLGYEDGETLDNMPAQMLAWEESYESQESSRIRPFDFPFYYSWGFETGIESFDTLAKKLFIYESKKTDIQVRVDQMGEGLDYNTLKQSPKRSVIGIPAAMTSVGYKQGQPFPSKNNAQEKELYQRFFDLISKSPILNENLEETTSSNSSINIESDDPWITPPLYGGKHIMATSIEEEKNSKLGSQWLTQTNLDIHYRAAAGLGKKVIQLNQEEFVNRAWKQADAVMELNKELYKRLMLIDSRKSLKGNMLNRILDADNSKYISNLICYLGAMQHVKLNDEGVTMQDIMEDRDIPKSFASASFQYNSDKLSSFTSSLSSESILENISERYFFNSKDYKVHNATTFELLKTSLFNQYLHEAKEYINNKYGCLPFIESVKVESRIGSGYYNVPGYMINTSLYKEKDISKLIEIDIRGTTNLPETERAQIASNKYFAWNRNGYSSLFPSVILSHKEYSELFGEESHATTIYIGSTNKKIMVAGELEKEKESVVFKILESNPHFEEKELSIWYIGNKPVKCKEGSLKIITNYGENFQLSSAQTINDYVSTHPNERMRKIAEAYRKVMIILETATPNINNEPSKDTTKASTIDTAEIKELFNDDQTYKRMQEVAMAYYSEFYKDSESGEKLRAEYIDELLRSKYPILAYPIFPEPTYYLLKQISEKFILPSVNEIPDNSITMMQSNSSFVEAFLSGMNTEMGRELLWREYPTDQRGSYFRKFWDSETGIEDINNSNFFDVEVMHSWRGNLGENHLASKTGLLIFAIKGNLIRQYPKTRIYLQTAINEENRISLDKNASQKERGVIFPVIRAFLNEDIYIVGFKEEFRDIIGNPKNNDWGYFLTFEENVEELNFQKSVLDQHEIDNASDASTVAKKLINEPTIFGKHVSLLINN